ncbi:hypothetical protein HDU79_005367 [Rhizoclosmatium sp. JEL0117]|nr:hypothetical protein HDU79_005367 [Rhizoclosmatium sp. JEL0117]
MMACVGPGETEATCDQEVCVDSLPCKNATTVCRAVNTPRGGCIDPHHFDVSVSTTTSTLENTVSIHMPPIEKHPGPPPVASQGALGLDTDGVDSNPVVTSVVSSVLANAAGSAAVVPANTSIFSSVNVPVLQGIGGFFGLAFLVIGIIAFKFRRHFRSCEKVSDISAIVVVDESKNKEDPTISKGLPHVTIQGLPPPQYSKRNRGFRIDDFFDDSSIRTGQDSASVLETPNYQTYPPLEALGSPRKVARGLIELDGAIKKLNNPIDDPGMLTDNWEEESVNTTSKSVGEATIKLYNLR